MGENIEKKKDAANPEKKKAATEKSICKPGATWKNVCRLRYSCIGCQFNREE